MSNHAYIVGMKKFPTEKDILYTLNDFNNKYLFNKFVVVKEKDGFSLLREDFSNDCVFLYVDKHKGKKCLEFVHGHCGDFFWWLDLEVEHEFARKFEGKIEDDADGEKESPREKFRTYKEFVNCRYENTSQSFKNIQTFEDYIKYSNPNEESLNFIKQFLD